MPDYNGESASILPSLAPSIGNTIRYNQQRQDEQEVRSEELRSRREAKKLQLVNHVESSLDPAKFLIGESTIDQHTTAQLESVKDQMFKYIQQNPDADPVDIAYQVQQNVTPIAIAHAKQKAISQDIDKNLMLAKADLPVLNDGKLRNLARQRALLKQLPDGSFSYKTLEEMNPNANYVQDVINNNPELVVDSAQPLIKNIQSLKTEEQKGKFGDMYAGIRTKTSFNAKLSPFRTLDVASDGTVNGLKYKSEDITLPGGKVLKVIPEEQFDLATSDPNARLAFYKLWNENKHRYGAGNLPNDDPSSQIMQRKFLLDYLQATNIDHSSYSSSDEQYKNKTQSDIEAGLGTPMQQWQQKEATREGNRLTNEAVHNEHVNERQDKSIQARKDLKLTPGAKAPSVVHKKGNASHYGL